MNLKFTVGLIFAVVGYGIVVAIGVQYLALHVRPTDLLQWLAPVNILWATEGEPPWSFLLAVIAPLNAALYGGVAVAVTSIAQRFSKRDKEREE